MRSYRHIDTEARDRFLDLLDILGEYPSLPEVKQELWHRGYKEQISFEELLKLGHYLTSDDFFYEVEPLLFYHYRDGTDVWEKELNHIYRRSITPIHQMN